MRKLCVLLLAGAIGWSFALCPTLKAADKDSPTKTEVEKTDAGKTATAKTDTDSSRRSERADAREHRPYLGVGIEPLHEAMLRHLPQLLRDGRGIMVTEVHHDSPADKAGIKAHDIITSYDDQKLYSPEQLAKLIRNDKAGREIKLGLIHDGKAEDLTVTLGDHHDVHSRRDADQAHRMIRGPMADRIRNRLVSDSEHLHSWTSFDAMTISRVDKDHFKAEIKYRDKEGRTETRTFQGTHDELRKAIEAQTDLPDNEREHLLRALDLPAHGFEIDLPGVRIVPGESRSSGL